MSLELKVHRSIPVNYIFFHLEFIIVLKIVLVTKKDNGQVNNVPNIGAKESKFNFHHLHLECFIL